MHEMKERSRSASRVSRTSAARFLCAVILAAGNATMAADTPPSSRELWNQEQAPFRIFGNTWYVGTRGLSSVLVVSDQGHVLIDGALPESAPGIAASIRALGFHIEDIKLILNSHAHSDHAGGTAELQRLSGERSTISPEACAPRNRCPAIS